MLRVLEVTFPIFALVFCGFFAQRGRLLPERAVEGINAFVFFFALPAMLFRVIATQPLASFTDLRFAAGFALTGLAVCLFTRSAALPARRSRSARLDAAQRSEAAALGLSAAHGNVGYLGVPLVLELGEQYAPAIVLVVVCDIFVIITLSIALLELARRPQHDAAPGRTPVAAAVLGGLAGSPLVLSMAAGFAWTLAAAPMPAVMANFVRMLSDAAGPCALFAIGASIGERRIEFSRTVRSLLAIKLVAHPALAALVLFAIVRADPGPAAIGVLAASLPGASNGYIIAQRYGVDTREISASIVAGTFASLISVSAVIWLLGLRAG